MVGLKETLYYVRFEHTLVHGGVTKLSYGGAKGDSLLLPYLLPYLVTVGLLNLVTVGLKETHGYLT